MYGRGAGPIAAVLSAGTVAVLPATGVDFLTSLAVSLGAGLVTWGVVYVVQRSKAL